LKQGRLFAGFVLSGASLSVLRLDVRVFKKLKLPVLKFDFEYRNRLCYTNQNLNMIIYKGMM